MINLEERLALYIRLRKGSCIDGDIASLPPLLLGTSHTKLLGSHAVAEVPAWYTGLMVLDALKA